MLWIAYKPAVDTGATEQVAEAGSTLAPTQSASPLQTPSVPEESTPAQSEEQTEQSSGSGSTKTSGGGGSGSSDSGSSGKKSSGTKATPSASATAVGQEIIGKGSNRCVDVPNSEDGKGRDGTQLQLWDCAAGANQKWDFRGDGTVRSLGMCMDVAWGSKDDGAHIQLARCSGNPAQQFVLSTAGDLVNPQADKCVDAVDNGTANGTKLQLWSCAGTPNQKWRVQN
jgi:hypothetical protein